MHNTQPKTHEAEIIEIRPTEIKVRRGAGLIATRQHKDDKKEADKRACRGKVEGEQS